MSGDRHPTLNAVPAPPRAGSPTPVQPVEDLQRPQFRVLVMVRYALLALSVAAGLVRLPEAAIPGLVLVALAGMIALSVTVHLLLRRPGPCPRPTLWADLVLTIALTLLSVPALGHVAEPAAYLPVTAFWLLTSPMLLAAAYGWRGGAVSSLILAVVVFALRPGGDPVSWGLPLTMVAVTTGIGWMVDQMHQTSTERERFQLASAALAERQRLNRIVHDGVLQVLAMVARDGRNLGPRGALLGEQALQAEHQLRSLLQDLDIDPDRATRTDMTHRNFSSILDRHASGRVTVSTPADPILLEGRRARELDAAITEALTNVAKHAGPQARAWVLLETEGDDVMVSIRDNGVGGDPRAFEDAMRSGRLGMKHSIYGRIRDLGGVATLHTAPGRGVEWEFRIPLEGAQ